MSRSKEYIDNTFDLLQVPREFNNVMVPKEWVSSVVHYISIERIKENDNLLKEVEANLDKLSKFENYDKFFEDEWRKVLSDKSLLHRCCERSDYFDHIRINSPISPSDIVSTEEKDLIIRELYKRLNRD